jgi:hypothetical protein
MDYMGEEIYIPEHANNEMAEKIIENAASRMGAKLANIALQNKNEWVVFDLSFRDSGTSQNKVLSCAYYFAEQREVEVYTTNYEDMNWWTLSSTACKEIWRRVKRLFGKMRIK